MSCRKRTWSRDYRAEILRQGKFVARTQHFATARIWAEQQGALSSSLRIATGVAHLWHDMVAPQRRLRN